MGRERNHVESSQESQEALSSPAFEKPPVIETALGIQFKDLPKFDVIHFGLFYETVRDRFPTFQYESRLGKMVETFPRKPLRNLVGIRKGARAERVMYIDENQESLLQIQQDRFGFNWRKIGEHSPYPRYQQCSQQCLEEFENFRDFCDRNNLGIVQVDLCEVVYVNHIYPDKEEDLIDLFEAVFSGLQWSHSTDFLPRPEVAAMHRAYVIGHNQGRLTVEVSLAADEAGRELIELKMIGRVLQKPQKAVSETLQLAHDWVVKGFESITDETIRKDRWRQLA